MGDDQIRARGSRWFSLWTCELQNHEAGQATEIAVSANAGTYAMPDLTTDWPWGLGATEVNEVVAILYSLKGEVLRV